MITSPPWISIPCALYPWFAKIAVALPSPLPKSNTVAGGSGISFAFLALVIAPCTHA